MKKLIIVVIVLALGLICVLGWMLLSKPKTVGKGIREEDFKEFYYTHSTTVDPPEFQRYRIFVDSGRKLFYHEKREGDSVFLTEEDITESGETELTDEEWEIFWSCILGGTVENRKEAVTSGGSGPWLYLYWSGDKDRCREFTFADPEKLTEFEEFCESLRSK